MFFRTLACLPALTGAWAERGGGIAKSVGSYSDALVDERRPVPARPRTRRRSRRAADAEHEPPRRDPHHTARRRGDRPRRARADRLELQSARHRAPRRAHPRRDGTRRPVHRRARAVPHRHRPLRRHRAAGHHPDRERRRRAAVGPPVDRLERRGDRAARRVVLEHRAVPSSRPRDGLHRAVRCSTTTTRCCATRCRPSTSTSCARVGWVRVPYPDDGRPFGDGEFDTASGRVELASDQLERMGQPRVPTFVAPREGPGGDADLRSATRCSCSHRSTTPASSTRATRTSPSTARPRVVRSSSSTPPTPPLAASTTADSRGSGTTGRRSWSR